MTWAPDYITVADAKGFLRIPDALDDTELGLLVTAASRAIDKATNRQFGQLAAPAARVYGRTPAYDPTLGLWTLQVDDVQDVTGMLVNGVAYASSGAYLLPYNAPANGDPWTRLGFNWQPWVPTPGMPITNTITARWGWTAVPTAVAVACRLQVSRWAARRDSPYGIAGSPDTGSEMRLLARLDPDVLTVLAPLSRRRAVG